MTRRGLLLVMLSTAAAMIGTSKGRSQEEAGLPGAKPLIAMYGRNSRIMKPKLLRITTSEDWHALWLEHKTGSSKPQDAPGDLDCAELDFEKVMAVGAFEGNGVNCRGFYVHSIREVHGRMLIRLRSYSYQSVGSEPATQAWGIFILPRSNKEMVVERGFTNMQNRIIEWREWARYPAFEENTR